MQIEVKDFGLTSWLAIATLIGKVITWCLGIVGGAVWLMARDYMNRVQLLEAKANDINKIKVDKTEFEERMATLQLNMESKLAGVGHTLEVMREEQRDLYKNLCRTIERTADDATNSRQSLSSRIDTLIDSSRINNQDRR